MFCKDLISNISSKVTTLIPKLILTLRLILFRDIALAAARQVQVEYQSLGPVVVDIEKGMEDPLNIAPMLPAAWEYGDVDAAMASADKVVQGRFRMGAQYHFHMEVGFSIVGCN